MLGYANCIEVLGYFILYSKNKFTYIMINVAKHCHIMFKQYNCVYV